LQGIAVTRSGIRSGELRGALAGIATIDLLSFYFYIGETRGRALGGGAPIDWFAEVLSRAPVRALVIAIGIAGAVAFARAAGRLVAGLFPFIALTLLSTVHARLFGSPWRHLYYSGLCLLGWLMGLMASRVGGRPSAESYARLGSLALLGAAYLNAGISKLAFGGFEWTSGAPIQAAVVAQDGLVRDSLVSAYRSWVVMSPAVVGLFSLATVIFELAGPLMMLGGPARAIVALGLLSMHLNIYLLTHILYWQSMVLLILLGLLPYEETSPPQAPALPMLGSSWGFIGSVVTLSVAALLAIGHQHQRYNARAAGRAAPNTPPGRIAERPPSPPVRIAAPAPTPPPSQEPPSRRIGPFSLGDHVMEEWSIEALSRTAGGFTVTLLGPAGRARFEVNCADVEHRSPFDVGSAHIFYSLDVPFPIVQPLGNVLRDRVQTAAAPHDPCQVMSEWMQSAP
jgi:hypothetical protein